MKAVPDILLICVGPIKDRNIGAITERYLERLRYEARVETREILDSGKRVEGERIIKLIDKTGGASLALSEEGRPLTSAGLASLLETIQRKIIFIVGGPEGLSEGVKKRADQVISLSSFTFTHEMARMLLVEQLYRACSILHGGKYHKQ